MASGNPLARLGITERDLMRAAEVDAGLNKFMEDEFIPYARSVSPQDHGDYKAGIKVTKRARHGKGEVTATHWTSHFIENGTDADPPGTHSKFGRDTPTPAFAPITKTVDHFGGTMSGGSVG